MSTRDLGSGPTLGTLAYLESKSEYVISIADGAITLGTGWAYGDVNVPELISRANMIDSLPPDTVVT